MLPNERVLFVDCETTGLGPDRHEVWEVAAGWWERDGADLVWRERSWQLPVDLSRADLAALKVGRFRERREKGTKVTAPAVFARTFAELAWDRMLVGCNPAFDQAFLRRLLLDNRRLATWDYHLVDMEAMIVGSLGEAGLADDVRWPWRSTELSLALGVNPADFDRHTALGDVLWCRAMWAAL